VDFRIKYSFTVHVNIYFITLYGGLGSGLLQLSFTGGIKAAAARNKEP
jgi:hypothetical protein